MGYAKRLQRRYAGLAKLSGGTLQKRRDALNKAGVHTEKQRASFSTTVKGKERRASAVSKPPKGW